MVITEPRSSSGVPFVSTAGVPGTFLAMATIGGRWRWLGSPWFIAAIFLLAVNDHVLKHRFPGWWTGKLSDVAGVVVVAVVASVLLGVSRGLASTAVGFIVLKAVPGGAQLAAPLLGGITRQDPTDLIALIALVPLAAILTRREQRRSEVSRPNSNAPARSAARASAVLPIIGATLAMFATTATSCSARPAVDRLVVEEGIVYAGVTSGYGPLRWAQTDDGGRSWREAEDPPKAEGETEVPAGAEEPAGTGAYDDRPIGPLLAGAIWLFARHRWPSWTAGIAVALSGWAVTIAAAGAASFLTAPDGSVADWVVPPIGCLLTLLASVVVGRGRWFAPRPPPPDHWPPSHPTLPGPPVPGAF